MLQERFPVLPLALAPRLRLPSNKHSTITSFARSSLNFERQPISADYFLQHGEWMVPSHCVRLAVGFPGNARANKHFAIIFETWLNFRVRKRRFLQLDLL